MGNTVGQRDLAPQTGRPVYLSADGMPIYKTGGITIDWPNVTAVGVDTTIPIEGTFVANGKRYLRYGQVMARNVVKETQALTFGGTVSGGTFTITVTRLGMTKTTAAIAFNAAAIAVQGALEALDNVEPGDVVVTGGPGPTAYTLTWQTAEDVASEMEIGRAHV